MMPNFTDITQAHADAVGRFNLASKKVLGFLPLFRKTIEDGLGAPPMSVWLFPINGQPNKDHSGSPTVAHFDGKNTWEVGVVINLAADQSVTYRLFLDIRKGECCARIGPDGEPYEVKTQYESLTNKMAELAIEQLNSLSIDPAKTPNRIEIKQG